MRIKQTALMTAAASLMLVSACNRSDSPPAAAMPAADAALVAREADIAQREADLAAREAALTAATAPMAPVAAPAAPPAAKPKPATPKPAAPSATASTKAPAAAPVTTTPAAPAVPRVVTVPAGTQLGLSLATPLSSKTAKSGDTVRARVTSDIMVGDRVAIAAGTTVAGQVTDVVSGSDKIGGIPTLGLRFDRLELPGGVDVPIAGDISQKGKSDTARDTVKIVGGAAAGAILGHQVKGGDKGKVIGGLLGGAIGAVAAKKTGTEVQLVEGTELNITLAAPVEITKR